MISTPKIRFIERKDLDDLIRLCELHAEFEESEYSSEGKKQELSEHLFSEQPSLHCLVVEHLNEVNGYATYMKQFSTWDSDFYLYLDCLFMTEASRGYGIGEQLMDRIRQEALKHGCSHVQWQTPDFNTRAIKFYNRIGANSKKKERFFMTI